MHEVPAVTHDLPRFDSIRSKSADYSEALSKYGASLSAFYSLDNAKMYGRNDISVATWIAYRTEGVTLSLRDFIIILLGGFALTEKREVVSFSTFHPFKPRGNLFRMLTSALIEALAVIVGLASIAFLFFGIVFFWLDSEYRLFLALNGVFGAPVLFLLSRYLFRLHRLVRIPKEIYQDPSSPFRLHSFTRLRAQPDGEKDSAEAIARLCTL